MNPVFTVLQVNKLDLKTILQPSFLLIFSALTLSTLSEQFIQNKLEVIIRSPAGLSNMIWVWGALALIIALIFPLFISLFCAYTLVKKPNQDLGVFLKDNFEMTTLESFRAWGKTFLWSFVFLIPGVIKYINYLMTPFVVMFSERYKKGEVDALEYSSQISRNFWWSLKLWLGLFYVIIPIMLYVLFENYRSFSAHPFAATAITLLEAFVELLFHFIILKLFIKYLNEVENGAHV